MKIEKINELAESIFKKTLGPFGYEYVEIREGFNFEEEPSLFVKAYLARPDMMVPGLEIGKSMAALHDALLEAGETRFPYLTLSRPGDERALEDTSTERHLQ